MKILKTSKKSASPLTSQALDNILRGLQYAALSAHRMNIQQHIELIDSYFDKKPGIPGKPKMINMALDDNNHIDVPLISLVKPDGISLEEMKVSMTVKVEGNLSEEFENPVKKLGVNEKLSSFNVSFGSRSSKNKERSHDEINIDVVFKKTGTPEGMERIIEEYTKLIQPVSSAVPPKQDEPIMKSSVQKDTEKSDKNEDHTKYKW